MLPATRTEVGDTADCIRCHTRHMLSKNSAVASSCCSQARAFNMQRKWFSMGCRSHIQRTTKGGTGCSRHRRLATAPLLGAQALTATLPHAEVSCRALVHGIWASRLQNEQASCRDHAMHRVMHGSMTGLLAAPPGCHSMVAPCCACMHMLSTQCPTILDVSDVHALSFDAGTSGCRTPSLKPPQPAEHVCRCQLAATRMNAAFICRLLLEMCATCPNLHGADPACYKKTCSGHGTCFNGACSCSAGWSGADCQTQGDLTASWSVIELHSFIHPPRSE